VGVFVMYDEDSVFSVEFDLLSGLLSSFDEQYALLLQREHTCSSLDPSLWLEQTDYLAGLGFVACQQFISATHPLSELGRTKALHVGPRTSWGFPFAELANAAANHWKHSEEDELVSGGKKSKRTRKTIEKSGIVVDDEPYVCRELLRKLSDDSEKPFSVLASLARDWLKAIAAA